MMDANPAVLRRNQRSPTAVQTLRVPKTSSAPFTATVNR
jgi:hypothetical protein